MRYSNIYFLLLLTVILYSCGGEKKELIENEGNVLEEDMILAYDNDTIVVHINNDSIKASEGLIVKVSMKRQSLRYFHIIGGGKFDKNFIARDSSGLAFVEPKDSIATFTVIEDIPG